MANPLTGDFDAVVQIAVRQINGLLAALHQNGAAEDAPLKLLHSVRLRVGDLHPRPPGVEGFGDWVLEYQSERPPADRRDIRAELVGAAPPGVARLIEDLFTKFDEAWVPPDPPEVVRGRAHVQLSTLALSVPEQSSSEVTIHAHVRAHYSPAPNTNDLPAPIHGEVHAGFGVRRIQSPSGRQLLIEPSPQDSKIQFVAAPGSGLTAVDAGRIAAQLRKALRERLTLLPVDLPADFPFSDFKGVGSPAGGAIALPLNLSAGTPPAGNVQSVTHSFIGESGFAFAVSREHVLGLIDVEAIRDAITRRAIRIKVSVWPFSATVTYRLRFTAGPTLTFRAGAIDVEGRVAVETGTWWAPNGWVEFKQAVGMILDVAAQSVGLEALGDPDVDESLFIPHSLAFNTVRSELGDVLRSSSVPVRRVFRDAKEDLVRGLRNFDTSATATYTAIEITADGVIVRGEIGGAARSAPIVEAAETDAGAALTAFKSWIPGGRIDRFIWSWIEYSDLHPTPWSGVEKSFTDEHRFTFPKPQGSQIGEVCLRIEGTQIGPDGHAVSVAGGATCRVPEPTIGLEVPAWWEPVTLPVWLPDIGDNVVLKNALAGHVSVPTHVPPRTGMTQNALVYFADWESADPLQPLGRAFEQMRRPNAALLTIVVAPPGTFDRPRGEVERQLSTVGERFRARLQIAEDDEGGWSRTFGASRMPSAYLIDARRRFVWKQEGAADPRTIADALDKHVLPAPAPRPGPLRLAVSPGDRAPDAVFTDGAGQSYALHRLRGRRALFTFWQSWSVPCLKELERLQRLVERAGKHAPVVVAFHGGKNDKPLDAVRRQLGLSFVLAQDREQRIARAYGVRCWPTTVSIDVDGRVAHVQVGITHSHPPGRGESAGA